MTVRIMDWLYTIISESPKVKQAREEYKAEQERAAHAAEELHSTSIRALTVSELRMRDAIKALNKTTDELYDSERTRGDK